MIQTRVFLPERQSGTEGMVVIAGVVIRVTAVDGDEG